MNELETEHLTDLLVTAVRELRAGDSAAQRAQAARRLGHTQSQVALRYLIEGLSDNAPEVRLAVVEALGEIGDPASIEPLRDLLDRETSPVVNLTTILNTIDN